MMNSAQNSQNSLSENLRAQKWLGVGVLMALLSACSSTQITSVWKDPTYQKHPQKMMVISVNKSPLNRRIFEEEIVRRIKKQGGDAIASYTVLPDAKQEDEVMIAKKVAEQNADTVLITRMVSRKTVQVYVPGNIYYPPYYFGSWRDYYGYGHHALYSPGYLTEDEYALIETNLYDAKTNNLIWAATSQTGVRGSEQSLIHSFIEEMIEKMVDQGLLSK